MMAAKIIIAIVILVFIAFVAGCIFMFIGNESLELELSTTAWSQNLRRLADIGTFESYYADEYREFRLLGLLRDAGAPVIYSDILLYGLPEPNTYIFLQTRDTIVGKLVRRIDYIHNPFIDDNGRAHFLPKRKTIWKAKGEDNNLVIIRCPDYSSIRDAFLTHDAAHAIYEAVVYSRKRVEESRKNKASVT